MVPVLAEMPHPQLRLHRSSLIPVPCQLLVGMDVPGVTTSGSRWQGDHVKAGWLWHGMGAMAQQGGHGMHGNGRSGSQEGSRVRREQREPCPCPCKDMLRAVMAGSWLRAAPEGAREDAREDARRERLWEWHPSLWQHWHHSSLPGSLLGMKLPSASRSRGDVPHPHPASSGLILTAGHPAPAGWAETLTLFAASNAGVPHEPHDLW